MFCGVFSFVLKGVGGSRRLHTDQFGRSRVGLIVPNIQKPHRYSFFEFPLPRPDPRNLQFGYAIPTSWGKFRTCRLQEIGWDPQGIRAEAKGQHRPHSPAPPYKRGVWGGGLTPLPA